MSESNRIGIDLLYRSDTSMLSPSWTADQKECLEAQAYINLSL